MEKNQTDQKEDFDLESLSALVVNNPDLEKLESLLQQFNIFEALNAVHIELRHSDFLAFLLNPAQNHGLGDIFVKRLLQRALIANGSDLPITPVKLDVWDLDEIVVQREWENIDILLTDEPHKVAVIIENKVDSTEHSNQLQRYRRVVEEHYPNWNILGLLLTPEGTDPSDDSYTAIDYQAVCEIVERLTESRASTLNPDIRTLLVHYAQMLRRHIVNESEIAELCQKIYRRHQRALDMIYEYKPDRQTEMKELLQEIIQETPGLELDHSSKSYVRFALKDWDVPILMRGQGWTKSGRILLFEFSNHPQNFRLHLIIGPGPAETRQRLFEMASHHHLLKPALKNLGKSYSTIYVRSFLSPDLYEEAPGEQIREEIQKKWHQFLEHDLPAITSVLKNQEWIWTS
jgi:hypothetical protein